MKLTKITASIGPDLKPLKNMIAAGVNVCRLNFSHDTGATQGRKIKEIRKIAEQLDKPVAIMADLQGPKHRIGNFKTEECYPLKVGQAFMLDNDPTPGDATRVQLPDEDILRSLRAGDRILLNDGKIELKVESADGPRLITRVIRGDEIWSRRGFNLPDTEIKTSILTPKDRDDLEYALTQDIDWVAVSFVQRPEDIIEVRDFIIARTNRPLKIMAKIERPQAVEKIEDIAAVSDAIMIARGDLAVEIPFEQLPAISRRLIRICRKMNRPIIVATQMLGSMVHGAFPLRAEISDVSTAAYLRTDSTMTSEETTIGKHPVKVIETMSKILRFADKDVEENGYDWSRVENTPDNDWSRSVSSMAYLNKAAAIVVFDKDGATSTQISCRRPDLPIISVCNEAIVANQLCLSRGVFPILNTQMFGQRDGFGAARHFGITRGKLVIVDEEKISLRELD